MSMRNFWFPELFMRSGYWLMALFFVGTTVLFTFEPTVAETPKKAAEENVERKTPDGNGAEPFVYQYENRKDPFMPFITENAAPHADDESIEDGGPPTGLQLLEPSQLTLVGLLNKGGLYYALVEDSSGKGYILTKGMKIGRRGVVREIDPNQVSIEETAITRTGEKLVTPVKIVFKKEGEK